MQHRDWVLYDLDCEFRQGEHPVDKILALRVGNQEVVVDHLPGSSSVEAELRVGRESPTPSELCEIDQQVRSVEPSGCWPAS